jgi:hypothetical protein
MGRGAGTRPYATKSTARPSAVILGLPLSVSSWAPASVTLTRAPGIRFVAAEANMMYRRFVLVTGYGGYVWP